MNLAVQCLDLPAEQGTIIDLTGSVRRNMTYSAVSEMTDGLAGALVVGAALFDRFGVVLSQGAWCRTAKCEGFA